MRQCLIRAVGALLAFAGLLLNASPSSAQGWLGDRQRTEGPGFRVGNLELHPGLGAEIGYDRNVFFEDETPEDSFVLRLTGHIAVSNLRDARRTEGESSEGQDASNRMLDFRGGLSASYYHYFNARARDNVELDANIAATINPAGRFSVYLHNEYARTIRPFVDPPSEAGEVPTYARDRNVAGVEFRGQSRGGTLRGMLGYDWHLDWFEDDDFDFVNSFQHAFRLNLSWRFLPRTSLLSHNTVTYQDYTRSMDGASVLVQDNWTASSMIGINGLLTQKLSFTLMGGYAAGFYDLGDDFDSVVARADVRWSPTGTIQTGIGYERRFQYSFLGNYQKSDRIFATFQTLIAGAALIGFEGALSFDETGVVLAEDGMTLVGNTATRSDIRLALKLFAEYRFTDWLGTNLTLAYYGDFTDFEYDPDVITGGEPLPDPGGGYQKFEAWLGVRVFY